jgi:hypothetical protein
MLWPSNGLYSLRIVQERVLLVHFLAWSLRRRQVDSFRSVRVMRLLNVVQSSGKSKWVLICWRTLRRLWVALSTRWRVGMMFLWELSLVVWDFIAWTRLAFL